MNRRELMMSVLATPVMLWPAKGAMVAAKKYGCLTVDGHRQHLANTGETLHVFLDGHDVTNTCCEANDTAGYVHVYAKGKKYRQLLDAGAAIAGDGGKLEVYGVVVIAPGAAF